MAPETSRGCFFWAWRALAVGLLLALGAFGAVEFQQQWARRGCEAPAPLLELSQFEQAREIRLVALGDAGTGDAGQAQVAQAVGKVCAQEGCDLVLYLGDNFYPSGVESLNDPKFISHFEEIYQHLDLPFFAILGNHDTKGEVEPQRLYSLISPKWYLPAFQYRFKAGPIDLYGLNSNCVASAWPQLSRWLEDARPEAWQLVFAHHNLYGSGDHGDAPYGARSLWNAFFDEKVDLYLSGHEHHLEHIRLSEGGTDFLISGGGGYPYTGPEKPLGREGSRFIEPGLGFLYLQVGPQRLSARFFDLYGASLYGYQRERTPQ